MLRCAVRECGNRLAVLELKHNLAHPLQLRDVRAERKATEARLLELTGCPKQPVHYYVHFVFGLERKRSSWIADLHNSVAAGGYKVFLTKEELVETWKGVRKALGAPTFRPLRVTSPADGTVRAELCCWISEARGGKLRLLQAGRRRTIRGPRRIAGYSE